MTSTRRIVDCGQCRTGSAHCPTCEGAGRLVIEDGGATIRPFHEHETNKHPWLKPILRPTTET